MMELWYCNYDDPMGWVGGHSHFSVFLSVVALVNVMINMIVRKFKPIISYSVNTMSLHLVPATAKIKLM